MGEIEVVADVASELNGELPLVTFALFAYNQKKYIRDAVEGALAQDYPRLEIIISDDCSQDGTWAVIEDVVAGYAGPHTLVLNRNATNLGIGSHVNLIGSLARGRLVVLAAGDDLSLPNRTSALYSLWKNNGTCPACVYSDVEPIDEAGNHVLGWKESIYPGPHSLFSFADGNSRILGASTAYTRDVFTHFSPMSASVVHEDRVLPMRALLLGGKVLFAREKLIRYRVSGGVSRKVPTTRRQYLRALGDRERRSLRDAVQRLSDVLHANVHDSGVLSRCIRRITDHHAFIELSSSPAWRYELEVFRALRNGATAWPTIKLYLKLRFIGMD